MFLLKRARPSPKTIHHSIIKNLVRSARALAASADGSGRRSSDQALALEAHMPLSPDNDMIMDDDAERAGDIDDFARHAKIGV